MKALLICPADRPGVAELAAASPLVVAPLFGRSLIELWIDELVASGVNHVVALASDRPASVRALVGDGRRWGIRIDVLPVSQEPSVSEAALRHRTGPASEWLKDVIVLDRLPGAPDMPLFEDYAAWFAATRGWIPRAATPGRIGARETSPGIWIGLRADIAPSARLIAPCWIGDHVRIGPDTEIGPGAVIENGVIVDEGARVVESQVGPGTYVGKFVSVERSLSHGSLLVSWRLGSVLHVPDPLLLANLADRQSPPGGASLPSRVAALATLLVTSPVAASVVLLSLIRGEAPWHLRLALRSHPGRFSGSVTFAYYELSGARTWLRRWPQLWSIFRGDMRWTGNRPLRPIQALALKNDFERLWLCAPVGLISLADAYGCPDGVSDDAIAHASFYAVNASRRLDWLILYRSLVRSAAVWPIRGHRRKEAPVPLEDLVPKQEI